TPSPRCVEHGPVLRKDGEYMASADSKARRSRTQASASFFPDTKDDKRPGYRHEFGDARLTASADETTTGKATCLPRFIVQLLQSLAVQLFDHRLDVLAVVSDNALAVVAVVDAQDLPLVLV